MGEFLLGFFIGMRHALDTDHLSAVATLLTQNKGSLGNSIRQGAVWGLGHTLTLFLFALIVLLSGTAISDSVANALEWAVGAMLIFLGIDVLRRMRRQHMHAHVHRHKNGEVHLHMHAHADLQTASCRQTEKNPADNEHAMPAHDHDHPSFPPVFNRALWVGMMHGMAGSAALLVLVLGVTTSVWTGLLYVALFGLGTLAGMVCLTTVIVLPLKFSVRYLPLQRFNLFKLLQFSVAWFSVGLGGMLIYEKSLFWF